MYVVRQETLPLTDIAREFVGDEHGKSGISFLLIDASGAAITTSVPSPIARARAARREAISLCRFCALARDAPNGSIAAMARRTAARTMCTDSM